MAEFERVWQGPEARAAGLRLYPEIGPPGDIHALRALFAAPNRAELIADAAQQAAIEMACCWCWSVAAKIKWS